MGWLEAPVEKETLPEEIEDDLRVRRWRARMQVLTCPLLTNFPSLLQ
jgi:hypothetical protein